MSVHFPNVYLRFNLNSSAGVGKVGRLHTGFEDGSRWQRRLNVRRGVCLGDKGLLDNVVADHTNLILSIVVYYINMEIVFIFSSLGSLIFHIAFWLARVFGDQKSAHVLAFVSVVLGILSVFSGLNLSSHSANN